MSIKILFLVPYPTNAAPSQRFRFEQYYDVLATKNIKYATKPFLTQKGWSAFYKGNVIVILYYLIIGCFRRILHLTFLPTADVVFIHREMIPFGPPIFEWIIAKIFNKKIVYDFDDAIWLNDPNENNYLVAKLKWKSKVSSICKWSHKISVGNLFLADFAKQYNLNVVINPTTIDTSFLHNPANHLGIDKIKKPIIGWTGTHSTLQYLTPLVPVLKKLETLHDFIFMVIANKNPEIKLTSFQFKQWKKESEIADLNCFDIGVMPLTNDKWSSGKCGFKILQYMALKKPALASDVGVNSEIIENDVNGYLCRNQDDWYDYLNLLLKNHDKRAELGENGRKKIKLKYSVISNSDNFLGLFV